MPVGQMPVGGATVFGPEHETDTQGRTSLNVWSAQCQGLRRRQHRTEQKGHAPNPRTEIKIADPAGNRTRAAPPGWKAGTLPTTPRRRIILIFKFQNVPRVLVIEVKH